jgi:hypothetical protein
MYIRPSGGFGMDTKDYEEIKLEAIENLMPYHFYIPNYQRGYRWTKEQVEELLTDLYEFHEKITKHDTSTEIYCLQPLVIQKKDDGKWHVIDGQQRLTTLYILLSCLMNPQLYSIEYQTRVESKDFLEKINQDGNIDYKTNADYYHMYNAKETINAWLREDLNRRQMLSTIKSRVCFVLYKLKEDEDPIKVFQRLNIGKIGLTESELVKALFFNSNNFPTEEQSGKEKLLSFVEMANEWDQMEYCLQDDRFWLFFHGPEYDKPTRIDFLLDVCRKMDHKSDQSKYEEKSHPTFSYYYDQFKEASDKRQKKVSDLWKKITDCFKIIEEWYHDEELYHYIGYRTIFDMDSKISFEDNFVKIIESYKDNKGGKAGFLEEQKKTIRKKCVKCLDLNYIYEESIQNKKGTPKTEAKPLLLLHNIQTIIDQNESIREEKKYGLPDFVRFPFHLYKKENWDVEHIRPNQSQDFEGERKSSIRRKYVFILEEYRKKIRKAGAPKDSIDQYIADYTDAYQKMCTSTKDQLLAAKKEEERLFIRLWEELNKDGNGELLDSQKNKVWNYVLLDASTNREYGNSCYSIKREYVMSKEKGFKPVIEINGKTGGCSMKPVNETAFVPICTSLVFSKSYSPYPDNLQYWTQEDAVYYRMDMEMTMWWYLKERIEKSLMIKPELTKTQYAAIFQEYKKYVAGDVKNYDITMYDYCTDPQNFQMIKTILGV